MNSRIIHEGEQKTWALVFDTGDEVVNSLTDFARQQNLRASHFTAIGAFSDVVIGFFRMETKDYKRMHMTDQTEVLALVGDIALHENEPRVHAHVVLGKEDGTAWGGHLMEAHVRPTLELILTESPAHLHRRIDAATGLALLDPRV